MFVFAALLLSLNQDMTAPAVLDHVRAALHVEAKPSWAEATVTGKATYRGCSGDFTLRFQPAGEFAARMSGPLLDGWGFDGLTTWKLDPVGYPHRQIMENASQVQAISAVLTNRWLRPQALSSAMVVGQDSATVTLLVSQWDSKIPEKVVVDSSTWTPKSASFQVHAGSIEIILGKWGKAGPESVPTEATITELGDITHLTADSVTTAKAPTAAYAMPQDFPQDYKYNPQTPPVLEAKTIYGHLFVHPMIEGKDLGWFILDTCAEVQMIDSKIATDNGIEKIGGTAITGIGGTIIEPYRRAKTFTLGPAEIDGAIFSELDATFLTKAFGIPVAGIVGADFFERFIVSIDVEKPEVMVYDRSGYQLRTGTWSQLTFFGGNPAVPGEYEGERQGWFELDTGSNSDVMMCSPTVKGEHLLDGRNTQGGAVGGFGGQQTTSEGKMDYLTSEATTSKALTPRSLSPTVAPSPMRTLPASWASPS
jgi:hypothetical protein